MSYSSGSKYCYLYSDKGVLLDHDTTGEFAKKFGVKLPAIYARINNCTLIDGCFISYKSTFDEFLETVQQKYDLDNKAAGILVQYSGSQRVISVIGNSFHAKEAYFENEDQYVWQNTDWNQKYRPYLEEIEAEYRKMKEEILTAKKYE